MKHLSFFELKTVAHKLNKPCNRKTLTKADRAFVARMDKARSFCRAEKEKLTQINQDFQQREV